MTKDELRDALAAQETSPASGVKEPRLKGEKGHAFIHRIVGFPRTP
jgi:hypothetical protein